MRPHLVGALVAACCGVALAAAESRAQADSAACSAATTDPAPASLATLADFAWLEGTWRGAGPGGATAEIHYLAPKARVLPSFFWLRTEERVVVLESMTLVEEGDGITLYVRHFTPALEPLEAERALTLELVAREGERFVFRNIYDENPRCTVLERTGVDTFLSWSRLLRGDGATAEIRVEYRRVQEALGAPTTFPRSPADVVASVDPEEVRFRNGDLTLGGLFFRPEGAGPFPAAVFSRGSGPSSRDNHWTLSLVDVLVGRGIAVLLPDKRGSDGSEGDWRAADFEDLAGDALAGVDFVRSRPDVIGDRVGLVGLSQGGRIAPMAASRSAAVAFVVNIVGGATNLKEQVGWEMYHTFREAGVEGAALQEALTLQVLAEGYLDGAVKWEQYETALRAASTGAGADVARGFPSAPDAWQWTFFRGVLDSDPIPHWRNVTQPVLVLYGEDDANAPVIRSAYRLLRVWRDMDHPDAMLRMVPGTGHGLWRPGGDPHRPELHPDVVAILGDWITARMRPAGR